MSTQIPLLVDLDGSFVKTDTLYEVAVLFIKEKPWLFFMPILWFLQGKHVLKRRLTEQTLLNVASLPVQDDLLRYLESEHANGRSIILCTGCYQANAQKIKEAHPLFDEVIATDDNINLTGQNKADLLLKRFGERGYDYVGNEEKDLVVWRQARKALVIGPQSLADKAAQVTEVEKRFENPKARLKTYLKAIRIHQWAKNALLFVPLMMAHQVTNLEAISNTFIAFLSFSICASATYLLNDIFDLEADRKHRTKRNRPIAAGLISIKQGVFIMSLMMVVGVVLAATLNMFFIGSLFVYLLITVLYSFKLKKMATVDVVVLASLFTIRVIAGGAAINIELSFWLLSFSMFMFLSLALVKRVSELMRTLEFETSGADSKRISGRGYYTSDINVLQTLGSAAGFMAVLVMAFYINSAEVVELYKSPKIMWLICPAMGYWIMRVWLLTARGEMNEDPISFAITDSRSWAVGAVIGVLLALATLV